MNSPFNANLDVSPGAQRQLERVAQILKGLSPSNLLENQDLMIHSPQRHRVHGSLCVLGASVVLFPFYCTSGSHCFSQMPMCSRKKPFELPYTWFPA
jgi:hypothetical protein